MRIKPKKVLLQPLFRVTVITIRT